MTARSTSADYVTAFATGWPENQPEIMVLSLTTHKGIQDFAVTREQALLIAKIAILHCSGGTDARLHAERFGR